MKTKIAKIAGAVLGALLTIGLAFYLFSIRPMMAALEEAKPFAEAAVSGFANCIDSRTSSECSEQFFDPEVHRSMDQNVLSLFAQKMNNTLGRRLDAVADDQSWNIRRYAGTDGRVQRISFRAVANYTKERGVAEEIVVISRGDGPHRLHTFRINSLEMLK